MAELVRRDKWRRRISHVVRKHTLSATRLSADERLQLRLGAELYPEASEGRPLTRAECADVPRPCPYVSCKYHLFLDVSPKTGSITLNYPDLEPDELGASCCLDVADRGGQSLDSVGEVMNVTRERIRQIEERLLHQLKARGAFSDWGDQFAANLPAGDPAPADSKGQ